MAFVVGGLIIGGAAAVAGGAIGAKGSKDAAKIAAQGSTEEIEFNRESRDLARADQRPYREAGHSALNKLMEMTGLEPVSGGGPVNMNGGERSRYPGRDPQLNFGERFDTAWNPSLGAYTATRKGTDQIAYTSTGKSGWQPYQNDPQPTGRTGAPNVSWGRVFQNRYNGGTLYNVNEMGPEDIYSNGAIARSDQPRTLPPDPSGYVAPNIEGRRYGGDMMGVTGPSRNLLQTNDPLRDRKSGGDYIPNPNPQVQSLPQGGYTPGQPGVYTMGQVLEHGGYDQSAEGVRARYQDLVNAGQTGIAQPPSAPEAPSAPPDESGGTISDDPSYQFRFDEGMRALDRSAAARGGLLSGGFARKAIRYGQDYASTEYQNIYNRISNIAGLGQVSAGQSGNSAMYAGAAMGNAASNRALSSAYGEQGGANAWANAANQIAQLPWGEVFKR